MPEALTRNIYVAIRGICQGNPGAGAYTATIQNIDTGAEKRLQGREASTTANRMELTAAIEGLNALRPGAVVTVIANSEYVAKGMNEWLPGWKAKGWRGPNKKPVLNADLWGKLNAAAGKHERVRWVVGQRHC
ncbi:ribonuclease HI [Methylobacterium sp. E-025]|uniref:ribonuclease H family protein n=1 Tax=Methylobacterium sp. E-025 TaxID=2836561 RepID=UPI001FBB72B4|nr:ribonuclease H [Methylobacterium sp. E-025]MCJ2113274.1 ribonuclease HI [Methylobacterium sp. E-025]